jgi:hypothetical protein
VKDARSRPISVSRASHMLASLRGVVFLGIEVPVESEPCRAACGIADARRFA